MWMAKLLHSKRMPSNLTGVGNTRVLAMHLKNSGGQEAPFSKMNIIRYNDTPLIELHQDFLSKDECSQLLSLPIMFKQSSVHVIDSDNTEMRIPHFGRTSESANASGHKVVRELKEKIANHLNVDHSTVEPLVFTRYSDLQEYKAHHDYYKSGVSKLENNRIYTFIVYLNDTFTGGNTDFPMLNISVKPKAGAALFFKFDYNDTINETTLHAGTPVITGTKNIITAWVRKKPIVTNQVKNMFI